MIPNVAGQTNIGQPGESGLLDGRLVFDTFKKNIPGLR